MLKIRMQRTGRRNDPTYSIIGTESARGPKTGKYIEKLGFYEAKIGRKSINAERVKYWMSKGAQVSDTVHNFLIDGKIIEGKKINALPKKVPVKIEGKKAVASPTEAAASAENVVSSESETGTADV